MSDNLVKRLREGDHFERVMSAEQAADRIEELEAKLAKAVEIGDKMAASIEGNYYLPGVAGEWRKLTGGKDE